MERVNGIEPSFEAWEAPVLPLNYTRYMVGDPGLYWRPEGVSPPDGRGMVVVTAESASGI